MSSRWRTGRRSWIPLVARVEWRSEHRVGQRPEALVCGGERFLLAVLETWVEGPRQAGDPLVHVFLAEDPSGRVVRIRRATGGTTTVELDRDSIGTGGGPV